MGRYFVKADAGGYGWPEEPGAMFHWSGNEFLDHILFQGATGNLQLPTASKFFNPQGSTWIYPRPRQFNTDWERDSRLSDHVITRSLWSFASGVATAEFELTLKSTGAGFPDNKFIHITNIPAFTPLDATNYAALWTAAGLTSDSLPAGLGTVAHTSQTPVGASLSGTPNLFTPQLRWASLPAPDGVFCFGWSNFCWLVFNHRVILLRSPTGDRQTWEKIGDLGFQGFASYHNKHLTAWEFWNLPAFHWDETVRARTLTALFVGFNDLYHYANDAPPLAVPLRTFNDGTPPFPGGSWWIGAAPGAHFWYQAQVVGFETASTSDTFNAGNPPILWDLGETYAPTQTPERSVGAAVPAGAGETLETDDTAGTYTVQSNVTGCRVDFAITDETYTVLVADGSHTKGGVKLILTPGTRGGLAGAYSAPGVQAVDLRFPILITSRPATPVTLNDKQWKKITVETSLYDARYKRVQVDLKEGAAADFYAAGLHRRGNWALEIWEDNNGDGIPDTRRVRAWVRKPTNAHQWTVTDDSGNGLKAFTIFAEGLLSRVDRDPAYLPQVVQPAGPVLGAIHHQFLVQTALASAGIDPTDTTLFEMAEDMFGDAVSSYIPGTWGLVGQGAELLQSNNQGSMRWDETWLGYVERVARQFEGWVVYESLNTIRYTPEAMFDFQNGAKLFIAAYLFKSHADAVASGVPAAQCYLDGGTEDTLEPVANRVRVTGISDVNRLMPHTLDSKPAAWVTPSDENYTGEPITKGVVADLSIGEAATNRTTRMLLQEWWRRKFYPTWKVLLAPWHMDSIEDAWIDVGAVLSVQGYRDEALIAHMQVEILVSDDPVGVGNPVDNSVVTTRFACEKVPHGTAVSASPGYYPGVGG